MINTNGRNLCENCFEEIASEPCLQCGYSPERNIRDPIVLPCGSLLKGRYYIGRIMGKGGFGITYLAYDSQENKKVAVKEYYPSAIAYRSPDGKTLTLQKNESSETFEKGTNKFYDEAKTVSQFNGNPTIVGVYDVFKENGTAYIVMEYIEGITLKEYVKRHGVMSEGETVFIADKISHALMITHSAKIIHRDVSPDNIMLCRDGRVKLIDFGAAKQIIAENKTAVVKSGFTPIEQYTSKSKQGAWTDVYSLGATMYYMLTKNELDIPYDREQDDSDFDKNILGVSENLRKLIQKAVMIKADERYRDMIGFRSDLEKAEAEPLAVVLTDDLIFGRESSEEKVPQASAEDVPVINDDEKNESPNFGVTVAVEEKENEKPSADFGVTVAVEEKEDEKASADFGVTVAVEEKEDKKADVTVINEKSEKPKKKRGRLISVIGGAAAAVAAVILIAVFKPWSVKYGEEPAAQIITNYYVDVSSDMVDAANEIPEKLGFNLLIIYGGDEEAGKSVSRYAKECYKKTFKGSGVAICFSSKESESFADDFSIYYQGECSDIYEKNEEIKNDIYETVKSGVGRNPKHRWAVLKFCSLLESYYDGEPSAEASAAEQTVKTTTHKTTTTAGTTAKKITTTAAETTTTRDTTTAETTTTRVTTTAAETTPAAVSGPLKVTLDSEYTEDWNSTQNSISKADFEKIGGDVKVTLEIEVVSNEYSLLVPLDTENENGWQHITGLSFIECEGVQDDGWVGINIENPVCVFIVSEEVISGMTKRGMDFQVCGLIIKSALLEKAEF